MKIKKLATMLIFGAMNTALSGCIEMDGGSNTASAERPAAFPIDPLEAQARTACTGAVRSTTGNPAVSVISSSFSEAGTEVILRVGETGTWRCIGYRDGSTAGVMSITNEGTL
ncbi:hypothetical protein HKCCSP123_07665 [Rhodobacterales bacterium HKCCSP123]|nr:hypothetical protein [Rhodobacterales bacterium HKCCSP123]